MRVTEGVMQMMKKILYILLYYTRARMALFEC